MPKISINEFYGGLSDDVRQRSGILASNISHFDIWSNPFRLTPFRSMEAADAAAGSNIRNFFFGTGGKMYAIGVNSAAPTKMRLFSSDWEDFTSWTTAGTSGTEIVVTGVGGFSECLIEYKDYLWGIHGSAMNKIWKYGPLSGAPTYTEVNETTANTYTRCGGAVIGKDDNLYIVLSSATRNDLIKISSAGTHSIASIVLPATDKSICLALYGDFLAIGLINPAETSVNNLLSKIKLWDYVSADPSDTIICPDGALVAMGNVEGQLITVHRLFRTGFGVANYTQVGIVNGSQVNIFKVIPNLIPTSSRSQVYSGNLYFGGRHSSDYEKSGIYAVGRPNSQYPLGVTMEYQAVSTGTTNPSLINGFYIVDDYMWLSHSSDNVTKTFNSATWGNTSILETQINPKMFDEHFHITKNLRGVRINYVSLASGTIVVDYKVDGGAYTTIFTKTTATGETSFEKITDTNGAQFTEGREYQFRFKSTNGVEITGFEYDYNPTTKDQL